MRRIRPLAFVTLACSTFVACGSSGIPRPVFIAQRTSALIVIPHEPPPGRAEHAPAEPAVPGIVWIDGEWGYKGRKWWWTPGRWVVPAAGATYAPWCTVRSPDGTLYFAPAVWRDPQGVAIEEPKTVAAAVVESGVVVDPAGNTEKTMVVTPK